jgi:hypothetical protein
MMRAMCVDHGGTMGLPTTRSAATVSGNALMVSIAALFRYWINLGVKHARRAENPLPNNGQDITPAYS